MRLTALAASWKYKKQLSEGDDGPKLNPPVRQQSLLGRLRTRSPGLGLMAAEP